MGRGRRCRPDSSPSGRPRFLPRGHLLAPRPRMGRDAAGHGPSPGRALPLCHLKLLCFVCPPLRSWVRFWRGPWLPPAPPGPAAPDATPGCWPALQVHHPGVPGPHQGGVPVPAGAVSQVRVRPGPARSARGPAVLRARGQAVARGVAAWGCPRTPGRTPVLHPCPPHLWPHPCPASLAPHPWPRTPGHPSRASSPQPPLSGNPALPCSPENRQYLPFICLFCNRLR